MALEQKWLHPVQTAAIVLMAAVSACAVPATDADQKLRIVILTDISNEPDDQMSLVRFLTYANEFEVEGLIATTSCWRRNNPDLAAIHRVIDAYAQAEKNLRLHASGYPSADNLRRVAKKGVDGYGMRAASDQLDNEGVLHIVSVLEKDDPRPVWFCAWGGGNTLGGAVMRLQKERPGDAARLVGKIRGYEIALQDDGWAYIAHHFPGKKLISARLLWKGISRTTPSFNAWSESWGGNNEVFSAAWISRNIQKGHGPLGRQYPDAIYLWEGDTPSFLYLIPNGLSDPEHPHYGSWGGRFETELKKNVRSGTGNDTVDGLLDQHRDYFVYSDASDAWSYQETDYHNEYCTVFRWREDFQNDFAARMDWCVTEQYARANHHPVAVLNADVSKEIVALTARPRGAVTLSATGSSDPDGHSLSYSWFIYREAGTFTGNARLSHDEGETTTLTLASAAGRSHEGSTVHVILQVRDNGEPSLVAYRRAVITLR